MEKIETSYNKTGKKQVNLKINGEEYKIEIKEEELVAHRNWYEEFAQEPFLDKSSKFSQLKISAEVARKLTHVMCDDFYNSSFNSKNNKELRSRETACIEMLRKYIIPRNEIYISEDNVQKYVTQYRKEHRNHTIKSVSRPQKKRKSSHISIDAQVQLHSEKNYTVSLALFSLIQLEIYCSKLLPKPDWESKYGGDVRDINPIFNSTHLSILRLSYNFISKGVIKVDEIKNVKWINLHTFEDYYSYLTAIFDLWYILIKKDINYLLMTNFISPSDYDEDELWNYYQGVKNYVLTAYVYPQYYLSRQIEYLLTDVTQYVKDVKTICKKNKNMPQSFLATRNVLQNKFDDMWFNMKETAHIDSFGKLLDLEKWLLDHRD